MEDHALRLFRSNLTFLWFFCLILICAGDVELNPGPIPRTPSSTEHFIDKQQKIDYFYGMRQTTSSLTRRHSSGDLSTSPQVLQDAHITLFQTPTLEDGAGKKKKRKFSPTASLSEKVSLEGQRRKTSFASNILSIESFRTSMERRMDVWTAEFHNELKSIRKENAELKEKIDKLKGLLFAIFIQFTCSRILSLIDFEMLAERYCGLWPKGRADFRYCIEENGVYTQPFHRNCAQQVKFFHLFSEIDEYYCRARSKQEKDYFDVKKCFVPALRAYNLDNPKFLPVFSKCFDFQEKQQNLKGALTRIPKYFI